MKLVEELSRDVGDAAESDVTRSRDRSDVDMEIAGVMCRHGIAKTRHSQVSTTAKYVVRRARNECSRKKNDALRGEATDEALD